MHKRTQKYRTIGIVVGCVHTMSNYMSGYNIGFQRRSTNPLLPGHITMLTSRLACMKSLPNDQTNSPWNSVIIPFKISWTFSVTNTHTADWSAAAVLLSACIMCMTTLYSSNITVFSSLKSTSLLAVGLSRFMTDWMLLMPALSCNRTCS